MPTAARLTFAIALAFGAGALIGYLAAARRGDEPRVTVTATEASPRQAELERENRQLKAELAQREKAPAMPAAKVSLSVNDQLRVLADLKQQKLFKPDIRFLDRRGNPDPTFARLFGLDQDQSDQLQRLVKTTRERMAELAARNASLKQEADGSVVVSISPFPEEGGRVHDEFLAQMARLLGPERHDAYLKLAADHVETVFGYFGAGERTYQFGYDTSERPGQPFTLTDRVVQNTLKGGQSSVGNSTRFESFGDMAAYVGPLIRMLPAEFAERKKRYVPDGASGR